MTRIFVILPEFDKRWKELNLTDNDLKRLQSELLTNPQVGAVMKGPGRLRKMRFAFENRGKSGSIRVLYVDFLDYEKIYLITAYTKNEKDNLSKAEANEVKTLIDYLEHELKKRGK